MSAQKIASRYAKALYQLDTKQARAHLTSLEVIQQLFDTTESAKILRSPVMPTDLKRSLMEYGLKVGNASEQLSKFINTVVDAGRVEVIPEVINMFRTMIFAAENVVEAQVSSAVELDAEAKKMLEGHIGKLFDKKVDMSTKLDPEVLGGFTVDVGNYRIDMSLQTRLRELTQQAQGI